MKTVRGLCLIIALMLSATAYADSSNGDMSDRGGSGDLFTDPTSSCIEQSTFAVLQHFYPEHSFGVPCGFIPDPPPDYIGQPAPPIDQHPIDTPPIVGAVPEPGVIWLALAAFGALAWSRRK